MPAGAERFDAKATVLNENVTHHIEEEEQDWFPKVRAGLSRKQLQELGAKLEQAREKAPRLPAQPSALKRRPTPSSPDQQYVAPCRKSRLYTSADPVNVRVAPVPGDSAACLVAAVASLLRGGRYVHGEQPEETSPEPVPAGSRPHSDPVASPLALAPDRPAGKPAGVAECLDSVVQLLAHFSRTGARPKQATASRFARWASCTPRDRCAPANLRPGRESPFPPCPGSSTGSSSTPGRSVRPANPIIVPALSASPPPARRSSRRHGAAGSPAWRPGAPGPCGQGGAAGRPAGAGVAGGPDHRNTAAGSPASMIQERPAAVIAGS